MSVSIEHPASNRIPLSIWFANLYAAFISARQKQADARIECHLKDLASIGHKRVANN